MLAIHEAARFDVSPKQDILNNQFPIDFTLSENGSLVRLNVRMLHSDIAGRQQNDFSRRSENIVLMNQSPQFGGAIRIWRNGNDGSFKVGSNLGNSVCETYRIDKKTGLAHIEHVVLDQNIESGEILDAIIHPGDESRGIEPKTFNQLRDAVNWQELRGMNASKLQTFLGSEMNLIYPPIDINATGYRYQSPVPAETILHDPVERRFI